MKKKLFNLVICGLVVSMVTGCNQNSNDGGSTTGSTSTKGNCTAIECIKKIEPENTVEEINQIIGFDGELTDEKYNKYSWELSEDSSITVTYYSSEKGTIKAEVDRDTLKNSKVDFSKYDELKTKINEGISYSDFISYLGNVEGTVIEKSTVTTKYIWVDEDGNYLNASFSNSSNNCTFASGMIQ